METGSGADDVRVPHCRHRRHFFGPFSGALDSLVFLLIFNPFSVVVSNLYYEVKSEGKTTFLSFNLQIVKFRFI